MHLPDDEKERFFEKNPDFISEFAVSSHPGRVSLWSLMV